MKNIRSTSITFAFSLLMLLVTSCSDNKEDRSVVNPEEDLSVTATLDNRSIPAGLNCDMYVFWKATSASESAYVCKEIISLTNNQLPYRIRFMNDEIIDKTYRFLFVAMPETNSELEIINDDSNEFTLGDSWSEFTMRAKSQTLKSDYYYGIENKTGEQILSTGTIQGNLKRMVGQIVFDIFRIDTGIDDPMPIQSSKIASVLDRVYQIDIQYAGLTKSIGFDNQGNIIEKTNWDTPYTHSIIPVTGDTLQVNIPQESIGLKSSGQNVNGSARIMGVYGLTSSPKIRAKYDFKYYDTTPKCGNTDASHNHVLGCYDHTKTLTVNMPQLSESVKLLSILPNYFTVNKAGIRLDRIIDLQVDTTYDLEIAWGNENE